MDREAIEAFRTMLTARPVGHTLTEEDEGMDRLYNELCDLALKGLAQPEGGETDGGITLALVEMARENAIEECARIADKYPGVYGNSPTAKAIRALKQSEPQKEQS
jgi:hypothetical protein